MKRLLAYLFLVLGLGLVCNVGFAFIKGKGEVKMSDRALNHFINYIQGNSQLKKSDHRQAIIKSKPQMFILSSDGDWSFSFWCPYSSCRDGGSKQTIEECERETGVNCGVFASRRTIYWDNGINKKKNKARFSSKWSDEEIKSELKRLGFLEENGSVATFDSSNPDVVEKLKGLKKLYDDGALTKEDFEKAKKKILE